MNEKLAHANSLIFEIKNKRVIRFEPFGNTFTDYLDATLRKVIKRIFNFSYVSPPIICPKYGPQRFETNKTFPRGDYCLMFSYLYICTMLDYPKYTPTQITGLLFQGKRKDPNRLIKNTDSVAKEVRSFANYFMKKTLL